MIGPSVLRDVLKLVLCGVLFFPMFALGGMLATGLGLPAPVIPPALASDPGMTALGLALEGPLFALALAVLAVALAGTWIVRTLVLAWFAWVTYALNTQLEASIFTTLAGGMTYTLAMYAVPCTVCAAAVARVFPAQGAAPQAGEAFRAWLASRRARDWAWRLGVAALAFMPIYWVFGLMVVPFTAEFYRSQQFGLTLPDVSTIIQMLFTRSVLFALACIPVIALWTGSPTRLLVALGIALFICVGLLGMLIAFWMPLYVRVPHTLEIFADEFVYAAALVWLLAPATASARIAASRLAGRGSGI